MVLRLWPPIAVAAMVLLGWAVRNGSTPMDDWFHQFGRGPGRYLLFFTDPRVLALVVVATLAVALYRRQWRLAIATLVCPLVAMGLARLLKPLFGREKDGAFAYPSGHTTTMVVVVGMAVLAAGVALWAVLVAIRVRSARHARAGHHVPLLHRHRWRCPARLRDRVRRSPHIGTHTPPNLTRVNPACDLRHSEG